MSQSSKIEFIDLSQLNFDPLNPRLPKNVNNSDESDVISYLIDEANVAELMMAIGEQDYFAGEPLLVVPQENNFIVVEGNRRLCALKLLNSNEDAPRSARKITEIRSNAKYLPNKIPCQVFSDRNDILSYLGYKHITGIKEWDALAKARYLKQLFDKESTENPLLSPNEIFKILAKIIASKSDYVARLITSLNILEFADDEGILKSIKKDQDNVPFSILTTAMSYKNITDFIGLESSKDTEFSNVNDEKLYDLFSWIFGIGDSKPILGESRNLDKLARVVTNEVALSKLKEGLSLEQAELFTEGPIVALRDLFERALADLEQANKSLYLVSEIEERDVDKSRQIKFIAAQIFAAIESRYKES